MDKIQEALNVSKIREHKHNHNAFSHWYKQMTMDKILNNLVIHPEKSRFYNIWVFYLSIVSIIQSVIYSIMISYAPVSEILPKLIPMLVLIEASYLL